MYIEESFDTIFNKGYRGVGATGPPPMPYASGKSPILLRVNNFSMYAGTIKDIILITYL